MHSFGKERVIECVLRIILGDIPFRHKCIGGKIQEQTAVPANQCVDCLIKFVFLQDLTDNNKCSDPETSASLWRLNLFRNRIRKKSNEVCIRIHHGVITGINLPYRCILSLAVLLLRYVSTSVRIVNVGCPLDRFPRDTSLKIRYFHCIFLIHFGPR